MDMEGSTAPFPDVPECGILLRCDAGHTQFVYLKNMSRDDAAEYGRILDGTSDIYVASPRDDPQTYIGHCQGIGGGGCGALFSTRTFGYPGDPDPRELVSA